MATARRMTTGRQIVTGKLRTLRVDKGFGFIKDDTGKDYFFHQSAVYGEGIDNLREVLIRHSDSRLPRSCSHAIAVRRYR
jgi:hypothetical protein